MVFREYPDARTDAYLDRSHQHIAELKEACDLHEMELKRMETVPVRLPFPILTTYRETNDAQNELEIKQQEHQKLQKDLESLENFMTTLDKRSKQVQKQLDEFAKRIKELGAHLTLDFVVRRGEMTCAQTTASVLERRRRASCRLMSTDSISRTPTFSTSPSTVTPSTIKPVN